MLREVSLSPLSTSFVIIANIKKKIPHCPKLLLWLSRPKFRTLEKHSVAKKNPKFWIMECLLPEIGYMRSHNILCGYTYLLLVFLKLVTFLENVF